MTAFNDRHLAQVTPLCLALTLIFVVAARPARAEPLSTRLDARSIASERSRSRVEWLQQWGSPRPRKSGGDDIVISQGNQRGPLSLIIIGTGVVAGGVGAYFGVRNHSAKSDYSAAQSAAARSDARDRAQSAGTKANIAFIASGVLLVTGLGILFFTDL
jgi:hypothetical protein